MGEIFLIGHGGGGLNGSNLDNAYAIIAVKYPEGSKLTCTNSVTGKEYTAGNKYGAWAFGVDSDGEWKIEASNGELKTSCEVSITKKGQAEGVELLYRLYLYDSAKGGEVNTDITGGFTILKSTGSACEVTSEHIRFRNTDSSGQACRIMTANKIPMAKYSKMCFVYTRTGSGKVLFGAALTNGTSDRTTDLPVAAVSTAAASDPTTAEYLINSLDSYFIGMAGRTTPFDVYVYKIWLEPKI